jgi:hypothetical protein
VGTTDKKGAKLQTKHNNGLAHGKSEPLKSKQPKKGILLRQVDDAPYEVELRVLSNLKKLTIFKLI